MVKPKVKKSSKSNKKNNGNIVVRALHGTYISLMAFISLCLLVVYLLAAFSDHFNPEKFLYVSYLGIGYHVLLILVLIWLVALIILRHWKLTAVMIFGLVITYEPINRYFPLHPFGREAIETNDLAKGEISECGIDTLRLLTYNTCSMGQTHLSKLKEKIPVLDVIRNSRADIVCLQEYAFTLSKGGHTQEQLRKSLSDIYPYYSFCPNSGRTAMGIALFSKYPIKERTKIDSRKKGYVASMYYELDVNGRRVALVNNHLHTNAIKPKDRVLYDEMVEHFEKDSLSRIKMGLIRTLGKAFKQRAKESKLIREFIDSRTGGKDMPIIICGDMNDTPISYCYRTMRGKLQDSWQDAGFGAGISYHEHHFWFRIDQIFHSEDFNTLDIKVLKKYKYSDHYPVLATFQILPKKE